MHESYTKQDKFSYKAMQTTKPIVQRYRRTDMDRMGEWAPVGSSWKTPASSGLVAHDIYHHLPTDTGRFVQEVAALGAEWYVDRQALEGGFDNTSSRNLDSFERNMRDTVLNALDSSELRPFALPEVIAPVLPPKEMDYFHGLAVKMFTILENSPDSRARDCADFVFRFVQHLLKGYAQAKERFPSQFTVRQAAATLTMELRDLSQFEVPYEHEITITLNGYDCSIAYTNADASFLAENDVMEVVMMRWFHNEDGYPLHDMTLHKSREEYLEYVGQYFEQHGYVLLPEGESDSLRTVYVVNANWKAALNSSGSLRLPVSVFDQASQSPRGIWIL